MNIFFSHIDPQLAARNLNHPQLIRKMWIENFQMLFTTCILKGVESPYRKFNPAHESRMWLEESEANFVWLLDNTIAILDLYETMQGRIPNVKGNNAFNAVEYLLENLAKLKLPKGPMTRPYLAMKNHSPDLVQKYATRASLVSPTTGNLNTAWRANSLSDAVIAYQIFLTRKPYWKPSYSFV